MYHQKKGMAMDDSTKLEYVGFWLRFWASVIDTILIMMIVTPLLLLLSGGQSWSSDITSTSPSDILISYVLPAVAVIIFWSTKHATPGKMAISARIVDARTGGAPSLGQHIIRYLGYFVSIFPFCLGLIWVGLDNRKQGWHDKMAGTVVVRPKHGHTEPVRFEQ
jgi:uncharacterized RDD family membrane protein YckC